MKSIPWYVYMVRCVDGSLYTGVAIDAHKRFIEHVQGKGARYTRAKKAVELAYTVRMDSKSLAFGVEWRIKRLPKVRKEHIVNEQWTAGRLLESLDM
ncbi:MAG: GIY-YIG nuclease family protein [Desulfoplanes sp.]|nr:GIY-YIG nuclease family protein [Desulfoplanes sp.]